MIRLLRAGLALLVAVALLPAAAGGAAGEGTTAAAPRQTCTPLHTATMVAQVIGAGLLSPHADDRARALAAEHAGAVVLLGPAIVDAEQVHRLVAALDAAAPAGLPPLITVDEEGGRVARFGRGGLATHLPSAREQARTATPEEVREMAAGLGAQLAAHGVDWDLAPVLDLTDAPGGVIGDRSYSADAAVAGAYGLAFAEGLQRAGLRTSGKHFPDHGLTTVDTHTGVAVVDVDLATLLGRHLDPYRAALPALDSVMLSHLRVPAIDPHLPVSLSPAAVGLVRSALGFDGAVVTDSLAMEAIARTFDEPTAALLALQAGADVVLVGTPEAAAAVHATLRAAVEDGRLPVERLRQAVRRALALKGVTGAEASCLLGLPPVAAAPALLDSGGRAWRVRDGRRHLVPDPETLAVIGLSPVRYADEEVRSLPEGPPLRTARRFTPAVVSGPGADPAEVAVARAVDRHGPAGSAALVTVADTSPWAAAVAAAVAAPPAGSGSGPPAGATPPPSAPVIPTTSSQRATDAVSAVLSAGGLVAAVGPPAAAPAVGAGTELVTVDTSDPVAAAAHAEAVRRSRAGPADVVLLTHPGVGEALTTLLPWLAAGGRGVLLTPRDRLDPRTAEALAAHDGPVRALGLDLAVAEAAGATPLPETADALLGWLRSEGGARGDVLAHAGVGHLLAALPLAAEVGAAPLLVGADGPEAGSAAAISGWHLPAGATRVIFAAGVDPSPLLGLGMPPYVARPGR